MSSFSKQIPVLLLAILCIGGSYTLGYARGTEHFNIHAASAHLINISDIHEENVDFAPFWKAWSILEEKYVPTATSTSVVTDQDKVWGAIQGLAGSLGDPYTTFFPPQEAKTFAEDIRGNFEGVGMEMSVRDGVLTVIAPLKGLPAEKAGVQAGDKVIGIDGAPTGHMTIDEAVSTIRGERGTPVVFTIVREGVSEPLEITVVRDTIDIPTINTKLVGPDNDVFVIELYNFSSVSANLFRDALREFIQSGRHKLIIDLRGNPGGYLEAAVDMASWFLPQGKTIVVEDAGGKGTNQIYRSRGYDVFGDTYKVALLVDQGSASASEILAGALRDNGKAVLVGAQTFGKGSVQELVTLTPETSLKVTVARWFTPNGISISAHGLTPDYEVVLTTEDVAAGRDLQLEKAIEVLHK